MFRTVLSSFVAVVLVAHAALAAQAPATQPPSKASARSAASVAPASAPININTASVAELDGLPGIGAKTAALIVEYRQKNGPFKKIEELMNVRGVGEKSFMEMKDRITVGSAK